MRGAFRNWLNLYSFYFLLRLFDHFASLLGRIVELCDLIKIIETIETIEAIETIGIIEAVGNKTVS